MDRASDPLPPLGAGAVIVEFSREELEAVRDALWGLDDEYGLQVPRRSVVDGHTREQVIAAYKAGKALIEKVERVLGDPA